jgi:mannose-6-phosphate isomerase-like protein (cupin superfamily)
MQTVEVRNQPILANPHGVEARKLYDSEHAQAMHITLQPGQSLQRHITPVDVFFYVLQGTGVVEIGDESRPAGPDTLIESPAGNSHCWHNRGDAVLRVLVVKTPRPTENTKTL